MRRFRMFAQNGARWILLAALAGVALFAQYGGWAAAPAVVAMAGLMLFYRDPDRRLPSHPLDVMSPVDGVVTAVDLHHDPFAKRAARRVRLRCGAWRAYHDRSPTEGRLVEYWPHADGYGDGDDRRGRQHAQDKRGRQAAWWIQTDERDDVVVVARWRPPWGKPRCRAQAGERVGQSRRFARFPVFCEVDVMVDENSFVAARAGQRVVAGVDTLATFNHDAARHNHNVDAAAAAVSTPSTADAGDAVMGGPAMVAARKGGSTGGANT